VNVAHRPEELEPARRSVAIGTFDGVHRGHRRVLDAARTASLRSTVVTFDPHPRTVLGAPVELLATLERRLELFEEAGLDDALVLRFDQELLALAPEAFAETVLRAIGTEVVAAGEGFRFGHGRAGDLALLERLGFEVRRVPLLDGVSSSRIRKLLVAGDVEQVAHLLGRPPEVEGIVVLGDQRGRLLGFPTANLETPNELIPRNGVYVTLLGVSGRRYKAVTNVGVRPTITAGASAPPLSIETHVLDAHLELYGREVTLEFLLRLREERRFPGKDALVAQTQKDIQRARRYFQRVERAAPGLIAETLAPLRA